MQSDLLAKKIRENLIQQKQKLEEYLTVLEKEAEDIREKDADKLLLHIEIEKNVINELANLKKIIEPLHIMYENSPFKKDSGLADLKATIDKLTKDVSMKAKNNRDELEIVLNNLKTNIKVVSAKSGFTNKIYSSNENSLIDING